MDAGIKPLMQSGRYDEALAALNTHLSIHADDATAWLFKAISHRELGQLVDAVTAARRAASFGDASAATFSLLGDVLEEQGSLPEALEAYESALAIAPRLYAALNGKGVVLQRLGRLEKAQVALEQAIAAQPARVEAMHNLAMVLAMTSESELAARHWREVLRLQPAHRGASLGLARALTGVAELSQALEILRTARTRYPTDREIAFLHANVLDLSGYPNEAEDAYRLASLGPDARDDDIRTFGEFLFKRGKLSEAQEVLAPLVSKRDTKARLMSALALPAVYQDRAHLEDCRAGFERNLARLAADLPADDNAVTSVSPLDSFLWSNFLLAYQGKTDLAVQQTYAAMMAKILCRERPRFYQALEPSHKGRERVKVGFVSSFFFDHTVSWYFQSWITGLARSEFDVRIYHLGASVDWMTQKIRARADTFRLVTTTPMDALAQGILDDANDILIFPELGMCPRTFVLASMRLAPKQVMGWGHPVTSGHRNVDFVLSATTMESAQAEVHYSEQLHKLPGIGTAYQLPELPSPRSRHDLGTDGDLLIIVPQSLFKIHPDNDGLLSRVLGEVPSSRLLFFLDHSPENTERFQRRLHANIREAGVAVDRVTWLPRTDRRGFLATLLASDLMLDTLHWSGGNTSIDALACGLPIVTLPGPLMRSRQTHGMLGELGLQEVLSVADTDAYVRKVGELAGNRALREDLRRRIIAGHSRLFNQPAPVEALQAFLKKLVEPHAQ